MPTKNTPLDLLAVAERAETASDEHMEDCFNCDSVEAIYCDVGKALLLATDEAADRLSEARA